MPAASLALLALGLWLFTMATTVALYYKLKGIDYVRTNENLQILDYELEQLKLKIQKLEDTHTWITKALNEVRVAIAPLRLEDNESQSN